MNQFQAAKQIRFYISVLLGFLLLSSFVLSPMVFAKEDKIPGLKPMTPTIDKIEPFKAGVEHNQYIQKKPKKKPRKRSRKKRKKLKSKAKVNRFNGRSLFGSRLDNSGLNSSLNSNMLNSQATRGIGIIGVKFVAYPGKPPVVKQVFIGTPAFKARLQYNDVIIAVDGVPTVGLSKEECYDLIVGTPNTPVTLSIRRGGSFKVYTLTRMDHTELTNPNVKRAYGIQL